MSFLWYNIVWTVVSKVWTVVSKVWTMFSKVWTLVEDVWKKYEFDSLNEVKLNMNNQKGSSIMYEIYVEVYWEDLSYGQWCMDILMDISKRYKLFDRR